MAWEPKIIDFTPKVLATIKEELADRLELAGKIVKYYMRDECPKKTGELKKSIRIRNYPAKKMVQIVAGNKKAWYVHLVINGSIHTGIIKTKYGINQRRISKPFTIPPNNFMQRAMDKAEPELYKLFGKKMAVAGHVRSIGFYAETK